MVGLVDIIILMRRGTVSRRGQAGAALPIDEEERRPPPLDTFKQPPPSHITFTQSDLFFPIKIFIPVNHFTYDS